MKKTFAILLLVSLLTQILNTSVILIDYYLNTGSYARDCVNKSVPGMHCNGKCQMMKRIRQQEKNEQGNAEGRNENRNQDVFSSSTCFAQSPAYIPFCSDVPTVSLSVRKTVDRNSEIFHPPQG